MRVKENVIVYQCEFCKRKMFRKHSMERHEKWCDHNPDNFRKCHWCSHLETISVEYYITVYSPYGDLDETRKETTGFRCKKLDKMLYPFKAEKKGLPDKYPETFDGQEPMPKECDLFYNE